MHYVDLLRKGFANVEAQDTSSAPVRMSLPPTVVHDILSVSCVIWQTRYSNQHSRKDDSQESILPSLPKTFSRLRSRRQSVQIIAALTWFRCFVTAFGLTVLVLTKRKEIACTYGRRLVTDIYLEDFSENRSVLFPSVFDTSSHPPLVDTWDRRLCLVTLCPSSFNFCRRSNGVPYGGWIGVIDSDFRQN